MALSSEGPQGCPSESILGEILVAVRIGLGSERLRLLVTGTRIIVVHLGKRGVGSVVTSSILGKLGGAIEDLLKSGRESSDRRRIESLSPQQILLADKNNFAISYGEVVDVTVDEMPRLTIVTILTRDDKFEFFTSLRFERVIELLKPNFAGKLTERRLAS